MLTKLDLELTQMGSKKEPKLDPHIAHACICTNFFPEFLTRISPGSVSIYAPVSLKFWRQEMVANLELFHTLRNFAYAGICTTFPSELFTRISPGSASIHAQISLTFWRQEIVANLELFHTLRHIAHACICTNFPSEFITRLSRGSGSIPYVYIYMYT